MTIAGWRLAAYRVVARTVGRLPLAGRIGASLHGRRSAVREWVARSQRADRSARTVWIHAASVGEALAAQPVIHRLRAAIPSLDIVLTHTSPALADWPHSLGADAIGFIPPEEPAAMSAVLDAVRPALLIFSRSDTWPELLVAAGSRGIATAVIGGMVRAGSGRLRWPVRGFLRELHGAIRFVGACTPADAERWGELGVPEQALVVTGDPRHDQVLERVTDLSPLRSLGSWTSQGHVLVAGSVEEADAPVVLGALAIALTRDPSARVLLVPHDPAPGVISRLMQITRDMGVTSQILDSGSDGDAPCLMVSRRGVLADLYPLGAVSYVGGGFLRSGLHAVIEPAAYGLPILLGPEYAWSDDASKMVANGGAIALPRRRAAEALAGGWAAWAEDSAKRNRAGMAARRSLHQGAAAVTTRHLLSLLQA